VTRCILAIIAGLALALVAVTAHAEDDVHAILPADSMVTVEHDGQATIYDISSTHFILPRAEVDAARASDDVRQRLERELARCVTAKPEPRRTPEWRVALRWTAYGGGLASALILGYWAGSR
jgi:hypothetical protein